MRFVKRHGLPDFAAHERISGYEVDFANHALKLAIELDGWVFHGDREAFERDRQRDLVLAAAGWLVVRVTWRRLHDEPAALATSLRKVIAGRT